MNFNGKRSIAGSVAEAKQLYDFVTSRQVGRRALVGSTEPSSPSSRPHSDACWTSSKPPSTNAISCSAIVPDGETSTSTAS